MTNFSYPYTQRCQVESPCKYTYTEYGGSEFLAAYLRSRSPYMTIGDMPILADLVEEVRSLFISADKSSVKTNILDLNKVSIEDVLESLSSAIIVRGDKASSVGCLNKLIQRFEVSKRLYSSYNEGLTRGHGEYHDLKRYLIFGYILAFAYFNSQNLQYLSTLLKVCDLIISSADLESHTDLTAWRDSGLTLSKLIALELGLVDRLDPIEVWF